MENKGKFIVTSLFMIERSRLVFRSVLVSPNVVNEFTNECLIFWVAVFGSFCMLWNIECIVRNAISNLLGVNPKSNLRRWLIRWFATATATRSKFERRILANTVRWIKCFSGLRRTASHDNFKSISSILPNCLYCCRINISSGNFLIGLLNLIHLDWIT